MQNNKKTFDRTMCFTFFRDYREVAHEIKKDMGKEQACDYLLSIIDYGLFQSEPDYDTIDKGIKYAFMSAKNNIDKSQEKRSQGFRKEDTEKTEEILQYKKEHPEASQRQIAEAVHASVGKVNKALHSVHDKEHEQDDQCATTLTYPSASASSITFTSTDSSTNISREREREHLDIHEQLSRKESKEEQKTENACAIEDACAENAPAGLSNEYKNSVLWETHPDTLKAILAEYVNRTPYGMIKKKYNLPQCDLNSSLGDRIKKILTHHEDIEREELAEKAIQAAPEKTHELLRLMNPENNTDSPITQQGDVKRLLTKTALSLDEWSFMIKYEDWLTYDGWLNDQEINHDNDYIDFLIDTANLNAENWKEIYRNNNTVA